MEVNLEPFTEMIALLEDQQLDDYLGIANVKEQKDGGSILSME